MTQRAGMARTLLVCAVYALGPAAMILMPMIVGGLVDGYGYSEQQAGNIAAMEGFGLVVASVLAALWIRAVSWTRALLASFLAYAALNAVSAGVEGYAPLLALRFLSGFAGGCVFAVTVAALGDEREPDRAFGFAQAVQGALMLAAFFAAPLLLAQGGVGALYALLAAASLVMLATLRRFPAHGRDIGAPVAGAAAATGGTALIWLGLVASVAFFANVFGFWAFVERIGQAAQLPAATIGLALGISQVTAIAGALAAAWASDRHGRGWPLLMVGVGQCAALFALMGAFGSVTYFLATGVYQALFIVAVSYQMGAVAQLDTGGRFLVMMTGAQGLGGAIGPALAGALIGEGNDYGGVMRMAALLCALGTLAFLFIVYRGSAPVTSPSDA
ncbi:MAG: MFS transporter [Gammaproteobacteria bacterium]|nr:MFS transporter [Gammaproteobacteria bacterium]